MKIYLRENDNVNEQENVLEVEDGVVLYCKDKNITSIKIPEGIKRIDYEAFYGCKNLESVELPSSLIYIYNDAFCGCKSLEEITIPRKVKTIITTAFSGCSNLKKVNVLGNNLKIGYDAFEGCAPDLVILYKGTRITAADIEDAFEKLYFKKYPNDDGMYEDELWELEISLNNIDAVKRQMQDDQDMKRGIKPDSAIAAENDFGF